MPDGNEPTGTPAASDPAGQQPTTNGTDTTNQQPTNGDAASGQQPIDGQQSAATDVQNPAAQKAAQEAARYRTELRDAQKRLAEYEAAQRAAEEAQMSELEKAQRKLADYQAAEAQWTLERQQWRLAQAVQMHAARLGIVDVDAAGKLLDTSALEYDENGVPTNTETLLTAMLEQRPWLRGNTQQPATPAGAPQAPQIGATNAPRQSGPLTITPSQYSDTAFRAQYMRDYGEDILAAINKGKVKIV